MEFDRQKAQRLGRVDMSRRGSIDEPLLPSVNLINAMPNYYTTSCCSGRIILFENVSEGFPVQKKGCRWLHVTHNQVILDDLGDSLMDISGEAVMKFEAMIMHIACRSLHDAQLMHQMAVASGFRNSGITVGVRGKVMIAIRSPLGMEVPLSGCGQLLVSPQHLQYLVSAANAKMQENNRRLERFYNGLQELSTGVANVQNNAVAHGPNNGRARRPRNRTARRPNDRTAHHPINGTAPLSNNGILPVPNDGIASSPTDGRQQADAQENGGQMVHDADRDLPLPENTLSQPEQTERSTETWEDDEPFPLALFDELNI